MYLLCVRWCNSDWVHKFFEILSPSSKVVLIAEYEHIFGLWLIWQYYIFATETLDGLPENFVVIPEIVKAWNSVKIAFLTFSPLRGAEFRAYVYRECERFSAFSAAWYLQYFGAVDEVTDHLNKWTCTSASTMYSWDSWNKNDTLSALVQIHLFHQGLPIDLLGPPSSTCLCKPCCFFKTKVADYQMVIGRQFCTDCAMNI